MVLNATVINISVISWQLISGRGLKTSKILYSGIIIMGWRFQFMNFIHKQNY